MTTDAAAAPTTTQADGSAAAATGAAGAQAAPAAQPQAGTPAPPAGGGTEDDAPMTVGEARKLRQEANSLRGRLATYERKGDDGKTELERTVDRITDLERTNAEAAERDKAHRVETAARAAAAKLSMRAPDLAHRLIDSSRITFDNEGAPTNVETLLKQLTDAHPELVKAASDFGGGDRGTAPGGTDMNALIRRGAGRSG